MPWPLEGGRAGLTSLLLPPKHSTAPHYNISMTCCIRCITQERKNSPKKALPSVKNEVAAAVLFTSGSSSSSCDLSRFVIIS